MGQIRVHKSDQKIIDILNAMAERACLRLISRDILIGDPPDSVAGVALTFEEISNCPLPNQELPYSPMLKKLLLQVLERFRNIDISASPEDQSMLTGSSIARDGEDVSMHIDGRRFSEEVFDMGSVFFQIIHELGHNFKDTDNLKGTTPIGITNAISKELGLTCWRWPDEVKEIFICPNPMPPHKVYLIGEDGRIEDEADLRFDHDPTPLVPFTDGERFVRGAY